MNQKLPGYDQAPKLIELYRQAGFSEKEILAELASLEELIFTEIINEIEEGMNEAEKKDFDRFVLEKSPTAAEIAQYLKLDKQVLGQKIERKIAAFIDQLSSEATKAELAYEEIKASLADLKEKTTATALPAKEQTAKKPSSFFQKILAKLSGA